MFTSYNWGAVPVGASTKQRENQCSNKSAAITIQDVVISHLLGRWGSWRTLRHFWVRLGEEDTIEFQCWQFNFFCCQRHKHWWKGARTRRLGGERPRPHLMLLLLLLAFRWQQDNGKNTLGYPAYKIKQTMTRQELGRETACEDEENWPRKVRKSGELRGSGACLQLPERKCKSTAGAATMCAPHNDTWAERQEGAKTQPSAPPSNIKAIFSPTHAHTHTDTAERGRKRSKVTPCWPKFHYKWVPIVAAVDTALTSSPSPSPSPSLSPYLLHKGTGTADCTEMNLIFHWRSPT